MLRCRDKQLWIIVVILPYLMVGFSKIKTHQWWFTAIDGVFHDCKTITNGWHSIEYRPNYWSGIDLKNHSLRSVYFSIILNILAYTTYPLSVGALMRWLLTSMTLPLTLHAARLGLLASLQWVPLGHWAFFLHRHPVLVQRRLSSRTSGDRNTCNVGASSSTSTGWASPDNQATLFQ